MHTHIHTHVVTFIRQKEKKKKEEENYGNVHTYKRKSNKRLESGRRTSVNKKQRERRKEIRVAKPRFHEG